MTTTVKVHVNGQYQALVTVKNEAGEIMQSVTVGPQDTQSFSAPHGQNTTFEVSETPYEETASQDDEDEGDEE